MHAFFKHDVERSKPRFPGVPGHTNSCASQALFKPPKAKIFSWTQTRKHRGLFQAWANQANPRYPGAGRRTSMRAFFKHNANRSKPSFPGVPGHTSTHAYRALGRPPKAKIFPSAYAFFKHEQITPILDKHANAHGHATPHAVCVGQHTSAGKMTKSSPVWSACLTNA